MNEKNIYLDMELLYKFNYVFGSILALKILDEYTVSLIFNYFFYGLTNRFMIY